MIKVKPRILLAEDDNNLGILLSKFLTNEGFIVELFRDGEVALTAFKHSNFDLCLIDVMMPKMDGFSLVKEVKRIDNNIPIIFITAKSYKEDKLKGYSLGADDFVTKPFDQEELLWKMNAIIRRVKEDKELKKKEFISMGNYTLDFSKQSLIFNGKSKRITAKESDIISYLFEHRNKIIKREDMLKVLWGENDYFFGRSLDVFITKIRKYLKEDPKLSIENVFGIGFIFNVPANYSN